MLNHSYLGENNNIIWGVRSKDLHSSVFMKIMTLKYKNLKVLMRVGEILFAVIVFPQTTCNSQPQSKICVSHYLTEMEETKQ